MDRMFDTYAELLPELQAWFGQRHPKEPGDSDFVHRQTIRAKALDTLRGLLPAAALSNVGIYGSGQGFEALLLRMRAHPLAEARDYAAMMLEELRKVIPSFLKRVDLPDRGGAWSAYLETNRKAMEQLADTLGADDASHPDLAAEGPLVRLVDFDPDGEDKVVAAMLYPFSHLSEDALLRRVQAMSVDDKRAVARAYAGTRTNRRHKPGRALERISYRFDVLSDYGAFRDLQRHRLLTIEWQDLTPAHGYTTPAPVEDAGAGERYHDSMARSESLYGALLDRFGPTHAAYAVTLGHRVRYSMQFNAREAMHLIELRSGPQGHPEYRGVAQEMHRLIADVAGHGVIAELMSFVDHGSYDLERLESERRAESRRSLRQ
jgi:thymidylate synthase ThyX